MTARWYHLAVPFPDVTPHFTPAALEERVLARWKELGLTARVDELRANAPVWSFYEGPPTANGRPGVHHVWARGFKDLYLRFRSMQGNKVPRKGGWDCHGLPVEIEVEKELGLSSKQEIERFGIGEFNERCRQSVQRYVGDWKALTQRAGIWIDTDDVYWTMSNEYIESVWWLLAQLAHRGLMYEGHRVVPYCGRCGTALSSHELGQPDVYRDILDQAVFVRFPILEGPIEGADLLIWTTTPWTLLSNVAVAVSPGLTYARVRASAFGATGHDVIVAETRLPDNAEIAVVSRFTGKQLVGARYQRPFDILAAPAVDGNRIWRVYAADFVEADEGTGLVHIAPAFGEADAELARAEHLPLLNPVDATASFDEQVPAWQGRFVKDVDLDIIEVLREQGLLVSAAGYSHSYPHCWRCQTPLIYWAKKSWFLRTSEQRAQLTAENEKIEWYPPSIKTGRFGNWLATNVDWALSRDRYWGTPLPVWRCSGCGTDTWIGSVEQLQSLAGDELRDLDLHRPAIDAVEISCPACGDSARRLPPVIDAWFDSGAMPAAQFHYPFENTEQFTRSFPADFICEGIDQTRGWFYSLLAVNALVFDATPYRNSVCLALLVDEQGRKMSKSRGNALDPYEIFNSLGADALRWFFFSQGQPWTPRRVSPDAIRSASAETLVTLWNIYSFFVTYANLDQWKPTENSTHHVLDTWILSELDDTVVSVTRSLFAFDSYEGARRLARFIDDLSNWYVRRSRGRFWRGSEPGAHATLHECLVTVSQLIAPFCPMLADELYVGLTAETSVHLTEWPADRGRHNRSLAEQMAAVRRLAALGRAARVEAGVKVRQPLPRALLIHPGGGFDAELLDELKAELNVKEIERIDVVSDVTDWQCVPNFRALGPRLGAKVARLREELSEAGGSQLKADMDRDGFINVGGERLAPHEVEFRPVRRAGIALASEGEWATALDLVITPELLAEGVARDLIRSLNDFRKLEGFGISDKINVVLDMPETLRTEIGPHWEWIASEILAVHLSFGPGGTEFELNGHRVRVQLIPAEEQPG
ncbi:MAG: isoleucine--tRNA ligase [Pseudonocardiaceae bacterium]